MGFFKSHENQGFSGCKEIVEQFLAQEIKISLCRKSDDFQAPSGQFYSMRYQNLSPPRKIYKGSFESN